MSAIDTPLSLFEVAGKSALIAGASGAFGQVAARVLAGAGCKLTLAAGNADALDEIASVCRDLGADVATAPPAVIKAMANHILTDKGLDGFMADVKKAGIKIL